MKSAEEKNKALLRHAGELNKNLPVDVWLKGNGEIWVREHGHNNLNGRKITKEEVITLLYGAIKSSNKMMSV